MDDNRHERERARLIWIKKYLPFFAAGMSGVTFLVIKAAGHTYNQALLVAAIMFAFVIATFKLREWFGVNGFIAAMFALSFLLWAIQQNGWL